MSILCQTNWINLTLQTNRTSWLSLKFILNVVIAIKYYRVHSFMQTISTKQKWSLCFCTLKPFYFKDDHLSAIPVSESTWCCIPLEIGDCLLLGVIYRSPNSNSVNIENLCSLFTNTNDSGCSHPGDFNIPHIS